MILVPASLLALGFYLKQDTQPEDLLVRTILENLRNFHYAPVEINDSFSNKAFTNYLDALDPTKRLLLDDDVKRLEEHRYTLDDESMSGRYDCFNLSLELIERRQLEIKDIYKGILAEPMDFTKDEQVDFNEKIPYAKNHEELRERWFKYLKYNVMLRVISSLDVQEKADSSIKKESMDSLEYKARMAVLKNHDEWFDRLVKIKRKDRLSIYINALTSVFDPHTNYFPPADKENFDIRMSGKLEGIGAQLQEKDGYIKVMKIIPGSPSALQGELKENDLIIKVAQGKEDPVDLVDVRIDDAVKLIRGKKGTEVRLTVKKPDGSIKVIPIIRDVVQLEETYAKSAILYDADKKKTGYVYLPSFYADFSGEGGRTSWKDVRDEIEKLKKENVKAIILDLRNNGGGSLADVVEMAGLFIPEGPVVQVKSRGEKPYVMSDHNRQVTWDGAFIVMVNSFSASASEILAAAMQDYNRAIILGTGPTHGKGTVQRFAELGAQGAGPDVLGSVKLTVQKFYRINGDATQLKGVEPDLVMPDNYTYIKTGEKEDPAAMPFDQIEKAFYKPGNWLKDKKKIVKASQNRTSSQNEMILLEENAKRWQKQNERTVYSLEIQKYREEEKALSEVNKKYESLFKPIEDLNIDFCSSDAEAMKGDESRKARAMDWKSNLKKDLYLYEALQIAEDLM